jgi:membrane-associated phospholipid phosphatase
LPFGIALAAGAATAFAPAHLGRMSRSPPRTVGLCVSLAVFAIASLVAFRWAGTRWPAGQRFDLTSVQDGLTGTTAPRASAAASRLLDSISLASLFLVGSSVVCLAALRRRNDIAVAVVVLLAGANLTTWFLKPAFSPRTLAGAVSHSFPSGHATAAMSVALATVMAAPRALRTPAAIIGAAYASGVGVATVVLGWHFPSDVGAGFSVATAWGALAMLLVRTGTERRLHGGDIVVVLALLVAIVGGFSALKHPGFASRLRLHLRVAEAIGGITVLGIVDVSFLTAILIAARQTAAPPRGYGPSALH